MTVEHADFQTLLIILIAESAFNLFISRFLGQVIKSKIYIYMWALNFIWSSDKSFGGRILTFKHTSCVDHVFWFLHEKLKADLRV